MIALLPISVLSFIAIATLFSLGIGWSIAKERLPLKQEMAYSPAQFQFIQLWIKIAIIFGVILPAIILVGFWHEPMLRQFFALYFLTVICQLLSETFFSRLCCQSIVVVIGSFYTVFLLWQLWSGLHLTAYPQP